MVCFVAQSQKISTKYMSGNVIFTWPSSGNSSSYDVTITRNTTAGRSDRVTDSQYEVKDAILYDFIDIQIVYHKPKQLSIRSSYKGIQYLFSNFSS